MTNPKVTDVSWFATGNQATGHAWVHKSLETVLGHQNYESFFRSGPGPKYKLPLMLMNVGLNPLTNLFADRVAKRLSRETEFEDNPQHLFLFYEGGPLELLVSARLAAMNPQSRIIFNFHLSSYWSELTESLDLAEKLSNYLQNRPGNMTLTAESQFLAKKLSSVSGVKIVNFPVYTTINEQLGGKILDPSNKLKPIDILIIVGDSAMVSEARQLCTILMTLGGERNIHIHWSARDFETPMVQTFQGLTQSSGLQSPEEYANLLSKSKRNVLLYPRARYEFHSSGRIEDALLFKCEPIVPSGTALTNQNGRPISKYKNLLDIVEKIDAKESKELPDAITASAAMEILMRLSEHKPERVKSKALTSGFLSLPSPVSGQRLVDKLSIYRQRLAIPERLVAPLRSIIRRFL